MGTLTVQGNDYVFLGTYHEKDIPKSAGFRWDGESRRWWTNRADIASKLIQFADSLSLIRLQGFQSNISKSKATDTDKDYPCPVGMSYYGYQKAGIEFALNKTHTLIADEMGLGKTVQGIGVINADTSINNILIVCPAILKLMWLNELRTWLIRDYEIRVIFGKRSKEAIYRNNDSKESNKVAVNIINYDILVSSLPNLTNVKYDLMIVDEAHYIKNMTSKRTKAVEVLSKYATKMIFLTGTPITKNPIDLFPILKISNHNIAKNWFYYATKYCGAEKGQFGWEFTKATNTQELNNILRSSIMVRRLKRDVLTELPPKTKQVIMLDPTEFNKDIVAEKEVLERLAINYEDFADRAGVHIPSSDMALLSEIRRKIALKKVPYILEFLKDMTSKVVLFTWHVDVAEALSQAITEATKKGVMSINGKVAQSERVKMIKDFQTTEKYQYAVLTMASGGVGITLTAASVCIFAEMDYIPANIEQAEDRIHRVSQKENVNIYYIVVEGTVEQGIAQKMTKRQRDIKKVLN